MSFQRKLEPHYNYLNIFVIHGGMLLINYTKVPFVKYLSTFYWKFKFYPDTTDSQLSIYCFFPAKQQKQCSRNPCNQSPINY
jgi:hypothetical protein